MAALVYQNCAVVVPSTRAIAYAYSVEANRSCMMFKQWVYAAKINNRKSLEAIRFDDVC